MQEVSKATELLAKAATLDGMKNVPQVEVKSDIWPMKFFSMTGELLIEAATTLILLYFLLSSGDLFLQKLVKVLPHWPDKRRAVEIVRQIEGQLFRISSLSPVSIWVSAPSSALPCISWECRIRSYGAPWPPF